MDFASPHSLDEALSILAERGDDAMALAGGTDLMVQHLKGEIEPRMLVALNRLGGLVGVAPNGAVRIGALTTHAAVGRDDVVASANPALAEAARLVGGWQTQAVGTLGGNLCNASPAADTAPAILVADGVVVLEKVDGSRTVGLGDFFVDRRRTVREPSELLSRIDLQPLPARAGEVYLKVGRRGAMEVALVGLAMRLRFDDAGRVGESRIAVCSMGPVPMRVPAAEAVLDGSELESDVLDGAAEALRGAVSPIDDPRAHASYRMRILRGLIGRAADRCRERAV